MLASLVSDGASGPLKSLPPYLSPMLWNTIATGKHPAEHGIVGFTEFDATTRRIQPMGSHSRRKHWPPRWLSWKRSPKLPSSRL